jgi:hypothetical protein
MPMAAAEKSAGSTVRTRLAGYRCFGYNNRADELVAQSVIWKGVSSPAAGSVPGGRHGI